MPPKCPKCQTYHSRQKPCPADPAQSAPSAEEFFKKRGTGPAEFVGWEMALRMCDVFAEAYAALRTAQLERERDALAKLAYIGEHHFPENSYKFRLEELVPKYRAAESALARQKQLTIEDIEEMAGYIADTNNELGSKVLKVAAYLVGMKIRVAAQTPEEK